MSIEKQILDDIALAVKEILEEELTPLKERIDALEASVAGKSDGDLGALESQVTQLKTALDATVGKSRVIIDEDGDDEVAAKTPGRDGWGRRIRT